MLVAQAAQRGHHRHVGRRLLVGAGVQQGMGLGVDERRGLLSERGDARAPPAQPAQHAQECLDHLGVELRADAAPQLGEALLVAERRPVGPPARHGVVAVDHAHGTGDQRDLVAGEAVGVAAAVEALVVVAHAGHELLVEQGSHDLGADARVLADELPLFRGERSPLEQHAVGHADLADVVQEGGVLDLFEALVGPAQLLAQERHVGRHPAGVSQGVVVLGRERRAQRAQVAQVQALDLFVQPGALEGEGHELADRFGGSDLFGGEAPLDAVEQADQTDHLVARHQGQRDAAALPVAVHVVPFLTTEPRVVEAAHADRATGLYGKPLAGPMLQRDRLAYPGVVARAQHRRGDAGDAPVVFETVDVAVGDLQRGAQAPGRRLQDLADLEARGQLEARLEEELIPLAAAGRPGPVIQARGRPRQEPGEVVVREAALAARRETAGQPAVGGPAAHGTWADAEQISGLLHAQPSGALGLGVHR